MARLEAARVPGVQVWKFIADILTLGLTAWECSQKQMNLDGIADYRLLKATRIPRALNVRLDEARVPGVEAWKFNEVIISTGLTVWQELRKQKHLSDVANYRMGVVLCRQWQQWRES